MWIGFMLATVSSVIESYVSTDIKTVKTVLLTVAAAGFGGHQANVIQYGLDQLHDASTDEITSFISWYMWTSISTDVLVYYIIIIMHISRISHLVKGCGMHLSHYSTDNDILHKAHINKRTSHAKSFQTGLQCSQVCHQ